MRGRGAAVRPAALLTAGILAAAAALVGAPAPAYAACTSPIPPAQPITGLPWAQRWLAPDRLGTLADGSGVTVAVVDSGVGGHVQLADRVLPGADFLDRGPNGRLDCNGHGTGVATLIAAAPRAGTPFRGLAPGVTILPVRVSEQHVIDGQRRGETVSAAEFASAIRWAVQRRADVINLSVVLWRDDPAVRAAIAAALAADVVVVAAAGNDFSKGNPRPYPAAYEGVLGVGATGPDGQRAGFSQVGDYVDLVAPGAEITVGRPGGGYLVTDGTSYAAPFVAATAALVRDYHPGLPAREVARRIVATADPAPGGDAYGAGIVNPYRAVTETIAEGAPAQSQGLPEERRDPAQEAAEQRRAESRERGLLIAAVGGGVAGVVLLVALVLPRGVRRAWRPAEPA